MQVLSNLTNSVKSYGHLSEILVFLPQALTKYGSKVGRVVKNITFIYKGLTVT